MDEAPEFSGVRRFAFLDQDRLAEGADRVIGPLVHVAHPTKPLLDDIDTTTWRSPRAAPSQATVEEVVTRLGQDDILSDGRERRGIRLRDELDDPDAGAFDRIVGWRAGLGNGECQPPVLPDSCPRIVALARIADRTAGVRGRERLVCGWEDAPQVRPPSEFDGEWRHVARDPAVPDVVVRKNRAGDHVDCPGRVRRRVGRPPEQMVSSLGVPHA